LILTHSGEPLKNGGEKKPAEAGHFYPRQKAMITWQQMPCQQLF
jgi:hypothetical protein